MRNCWWKIGASALMTAAIIGTVWGQGGGAQSFFGASTQAARMMGLQKLNLYHVDVGDAVRIVNELDQAEAVLGGKGNRVRAVGETARNTVVLTGDSERVRQMVDLLKDLDKDGLDSGGVFFLYPLRNASAEELAPVLRASLNATDEQEDRFVLPQFKSESMVVADRRRNVLLISTSTKMEGHVRDVIEKLDMPMAQVRVAVTLVEVKRGEGANAEGLGKDRAGMSAEEVAGMVKKLESDGRLGRSWRAEVLGISGKEATVRVGESEKDGIRVMVMPRVNLEGEVTMEVNEGVAGGNGHGVKTTARLKSGEMAVAGEFPVAEEGKVGVMLVGAVVVKEKEGEK